MGDRGATFIAMGLARNAALSRLTCVRRAAGGCTTVGFLTAQPGRHSMTGVGLTSPGAEALAASLCSNTTLRELE